jgi:hypothetical protein
MNRFLLRRLMQSDFQNLLDALSSRQHLSPHEPVSAALSAACDKLGVCPQAAAKAVAWLGIDPTKSLGRLRRTELMQLARSIQRFWRGQLPAVGVDGDLPLPSEHR